MIDIDPRLYLPESYLVRWSCPKCQQRDHVPLGKIEHHECRRCHTTMSAEDRDDLLRFRRFIA